MTEIEEKLWLENIQLRKQAHYYKNLHGRALAKQHEQAAQIAILKIKVAEYSKTGAAAAPTYPPIRPRP